MNKIILIIIAAVAILGGVVWMARPDSSDKNAVTQAKSNGTLSAEESAYDFGAISMAAGKVKHEFKIKNNSSEAVVIQKMYTSCMCTTASLMLAGGDRFGPFGMQGHGFIPKINQIIQPNAEAAVEVVFDPAAHGPAGVGKIQRVVTLETNAGSPTEFQFSAEVTP